MIGQSRVRLFRSGTDSLRHTLFAYIVCACVAAHPRVTFAHDSRHREVAVAGGIFQVS